MINAVISLAEFVYLVNMWPSIKLTSVIPEHWEGRGSNEKETRSNKQAITLQKNDFERELSIRVPTQTTNVQKVKKRADFNRTIQNLC